MLIDATPHDRACLIESVSGTWYYRNISEAANRSDIFYNIDRGAVNTEYDIGFKYSSGTQIWAKVEASAKLGEGYIPTFSRVAIATIP